NLDTLCSLGGAGKFTDYFKGNTKSANWNLLVVLGSVLGGFIAANLLSPNAAVEVSTNTVESLRQLGFESTGSAYLTTELFGREALVSPKTWGILLIAGFLVGFVTRYVGGCTS